MGVREFDVAQHQPHPPGYPVFMGLGKLSTAGCRTVGARAPEVCGLSVWSAIGGAMLLAGVFLFSRFLFSGSLLALIAMTLTGAAPLVWFNALRPLSDTAGLAVAFLSLAAMMAVIGTDRAEWTPRRRRLLWTAAFLAGFSGGFRSQMAVLTMPLLGYGLLAPGVRMPAGLRVRAVAFAATGVLVWLLPLVAVTGGADAYLQALGSQAGEDFAGVVMLWTHRTARVAFSAVLNTFVLPWESAFLAGVVLSIACAGFLACLFDAWRRALILVIVFGPYLLFHLLFQETVTTRYALPLVPLLCMLTAAALNQAHRSVAILGCVALAGASLAQAVPAGLAFGDTPSPIFSALSEMRLLADRGGSPLLAMHRRIWSESRRARQWSGPPGRPLESRRDFEWLEVTRAWREGHDGQTWFLADPRRTDLALIDSEHRRTREYRWPFNGRVYVGGARPDVLDWHIYDQPGWFLEQGWALTPEVAGISEREGWGPHRGPSVGWVRRRPGETVLMLGGRHLGGQNDPPVRIGVALDGRTIETLDVPPGNFLTFFRLPAGSLQGEGRYAPLTVVAVPTGAATALPVGLEQFNLQSSDVIQFGFDEGWFEAEYNPQTARSWRWMGRQAALQIHHAGRGVVVSIRGESPLRYYDDPPTLRVVAGGRTLGEFRPDSDFEVDIEIPGAVLDAAGGRVLLQSSASFVPGDRDGSPDRRQLSLRIYAVRVGEGDTPPKGAGAPRGQAP